ncbi:MAG: response regulator [Desulfatirhabdiaceae bacterium]
MMNSFEPEMPTVLCVDDEPNVLNALRRLFRKENFHLLTTSNGPDAIQILSRHPVNLIITDHRMPAMSGVDLLAEVRNRFPDVMRIILTGYTEVDMIADSINKGNIYKFILKPWDDQHLVLEIRQALDQHRLMATNKKLHEEIIRQNAALKQMNDQLEHLVRERTLEIALQNRALELSRAILDDLPIPIIGVSTENMIVLTNRAVNQMSGPDAPIELGRNLSDNFDAEIQQQVDRAIRSGRIHHLEGRDSHLMDIVPLTGRYSGQGAILVFSAIWDHPEPEASDSEASPGISS